jgi:hypothetical protein
VKEGASLAEWGRVDLKSRDRAGLCAKPVRAVMGERKEEEGADNFPLDFSCRVSQHLNYSGRTLLQSCIARLQVYGTC